MISKHGIILFKKIVKDNDFYIKILSEDDIIVSGIVFGGNSSKKKIFYQTGYFINFNIKKKYQNSLSSINAEPTKPFILNALNDKYKLMGLLSLISLVNISIIEGQKIHGLFKSINNLVEFIITSKSWIVEYCEWLLYLLQLIGYQIDYKKNESKDYFDLIEQDFKSYVNKNSTFILFPHKMIKKLKNINHDDVKSIFLLFENIYQKNHLNSINAKMPINFTNFKNIILERLNK